MIEIRKITTLSSVIAVLFINIIAPAAYAYADDRYDLYDWQYSYKYTKGSSVPYKFTTPTNPYKYTFPTGPYKYTRPTNPYKYTTPTQPYKYTIPTNPYKYTRPTSANDMIIGSLAFDPSSSR